MLLEGSLLLICHLNMPLEVGNYYGYLKCSVAEWTSGTMQEKEAFVHRRFDHVINLDDRRWTRLTRFAFFQLKPQQSSQFLSSGYLIEVARESEWLP